MKSKTKPKSNTHNNPEHPTSTHHANPHPTPTQTDPTYHPTTFGTPIPQHSTHESLKVKTCEEIETGGFGGFDETMATNNRCTERATEFCNSCAKSLCNVHYDALHRGHDSFTSQTSGHGLIHH